MQFAISCKALCTTSGKLPGNYGGGVRAADPELASPIFKGLGNQSSGGGQQFVSFTIHEFAYPGISIALHARHMHTSILQFFLAN